MNQPEPLPGRNRKPQFRSYEGGLGAAPNRTPPHSLDAEEHVLACCLVDGAATIARCLEGGLTPAAFYEPKNALIFDVMRDLFRTRPPVTLEVLAEELKTRRQLDGVGGYAYLMQVAGSAPTTAHAGYFIENVREKWLLRELIKRATAAVEGAYGFSGGLGEFMAGVDDQIRRLTQFAAGLEREGMKAQAERIAAHLADQLAGHIDRSRRLFLGLPFIDRLMDGIDVLNGLEEWLVIVAASRSAGKSSLLRKIAAHNCRAGKRGVVFSLESGNFSWLQRAAGQLARVNVRELDRLTADQRARYEAAVAEVKGWVGERLWLFDDVGTVEGIEQRVRGLNRELREKDGGGLDFAAVDYLQLIEAPREMHRAPREERVGEVTRRLHRLGKRDNFTLFVAAQMNRAPAQEKRRPTLADLRESGAIENEADVVLALHTLPEDKAGTAQDERNLTVLQELLILKRRNAPTGYEEVLFHKQFADFEDAPRKGDPRPGDPKPAAPAPKLDEPDGPSPFCP